MNYRISRTLSKLNTFIEQTIRQAVRVGDDEIQLSEDVSLLVLFILLAFLSPSSLHLFLILS